VGDHDGLAYPEAGENDTSAHRTHNPHWQDAGPLTKDPMLFDDGHRHFHTFSGIVTLVTRKIDDLISHTNAFGHFSKH